MRIHPSLSHVLLKPLAAGVLLACSLAHAQDSKYPDRPVNIVVSFAPGGATDLIGRIIGTELTQRLGQSFVVTNKPGAAGQLGTEFVAGQKGDGYTLLISATGHVMAPSLQPSKIRYDPVKSFEPIALLMTMPNVLVTKGDGPYKTFQEFQPWAQVQASVPAGSAGSGGSTHISGEVAKRLTGIKFTHVAYKGNGPSLTDVIAGHIPTAFVDTVSLGDMVKSGKLNAIAVTSKQRSKLYHQVPTFEELGFKGMDLNNWVGLYAPAGTPKPIVNLLNKHVTEILNTPKIKERLEGLGADVPGNMNATAFQEFVGAEVTKWNQVIKQTGVTIEE
ncbi:MAG: extra-cytoplasmic solute receptor [uncultured bacterium]|nr:MAG: extra-cytoplasmic solute receptor [uncultured bacterium]